MRLGAPRDAGSAITVAMKEDIERILIPGPEIARRVRELAEEITRDHAPPRLPGDAKVTIVPILTGAMVFAADLIRSIPLAMKINLVTVSSYPGQSVRSQGPSLMARQLADIRGRHVLLVDDILDSGRTLARVVPILQELGADTVRTAVLLKKELPRPPEREADYVGFTIPDAFVVGYGLDYDDLYRNLPDIVVLKDHVLGTRNEE